MPRVRIIHRNKVVSLRSEDHEKLLKRFNIKNFKKHSAFEYINRIPCPLCVRHNPGGDLDCEGCTLNKFATMYSGTGCLNVVTDIIKKAHVYPLGLTVSSVAFPQRCRNEVVRDISKIFRWLKSAK